MTKYNCMLPKYCTSTFYNAYKKAYWRGACIHSIHRVNQPVDEVAQTLECFCSCWSTETETNHPVEPEIFCMKRKNVMIRESFGWSHLEVY